MAVNSLPFSGLAVCWTIRPRSSRVETCACGVRAPGRVERGAHRLAVDGTFLQRLCGFVRPARRLQLPDQPHHQGLQLHRQIRVPVPQQVPQGLGTGDAVPQDPQLTQPGRMVPRKPKYGD